MDKELVLSALSLGISQIETMRLVTGDLGLNEERWVELKSAQDELRMSGEYDYSVCLSALSSLREQIKPFLEVEDEKFGEDLKEITHQKIVRLDEQIELFSKIS